MELTEDHLLKIEEHAALYADDPLWEDVVAPLLAEVRRLRQELATCELYREGFRMGKDNMLNQREEARGLAREYLYALWEEDSEEVRKAAREKEAQFHPWLLEPEPATATGVAEAVFGMTQIEERD